MDFPKWIRLWFLVYLHHSLEHYEAWKDEERSHSLNPPPPPSFLNGEKNCFNGGGSKFFSINGWVGKNGGVVIKMGVCVYFRVCHMPFLWYCYMHSYHIISIFTILFIVTISKNHSEYRQFNVLQVNVKYKPLIFSR